MTNDRNIPPEIKRILRKEAGFGCCICGHPFIQYHHIIEYAQRADHIPEDMMILCPNHHYEATVHALSVQKQRECKDRPLNIVNRGVAGAIHILEGEKEVFLGGNDFHNNGTLLMVNEEPIISTIYEEDGVLLLSLNLYDRENNLVATMIENEWETNPEIHWDLEARPLELIIKENRKDIILKINTRNNKIEITGHLWKDRQSIELRSEGMILEGAAINSFINCGFVNRPIRIDTAKKTVTI